MQSSIARVYVNRIEVGTLPADTYHAIVKSVRRERRLYLGWAFAATQACLRPVIEFYKSLPATVVGLLLLLAAIWPDLFTAFITDLKAATPAQITEALRGLLRYLSLVFMFGFPLLVLFKRDLMSFESPFDRAISHHIRSLLEVPAEGSLTVEVIALPAEAKSSSNG